MKIGQTAKMIDANINKSHTPYYFGMCTKWNQNKGSWEKVNSNFIARKYSQIYELVKETKAKVYIAENMLCIEYGQGSAKLAIDELIKNVLIPELKQITVIN